MVDPHMAAPVTGDAGDIAIGLRILAAHQLAQGLQTTGRLCGKAADVLETLTRTLAEIARDKREEMEQAERTGKVLDAAGMVQECRVLEAMLAGQWIAIVAISKADNCTITPAHVGLISRHALESQHFYAPDFPAAFVQARAWIAARSAGG